MLRKAAAEKSKKPNRPRNRKWSALLIFVVLIYIVLFFGIYVFAGGADIRTLLFGPLKPSPLSPDTEAEAPDVASSPSSSEKTTVLPPLDDVPRDDWSPTMSGPPSLPPFPSAAASPPKNTSEKEAPSRPVPGVSFVSKMSPIKCWDARGFEHGPDECDALLGMSRAVDLNLDLVERCRTEVTGSSSTGALAVFAEADFVRNSISIWPGTASTLRNADAIAECMTERFRTLSVMAVPHQFSRYRLKGEIRFTGATSARNVSAPAAMITPSRTEELEQAAEKAEEVTVSRDRVRVRKAPVDGEIIGFISSGQKVKLIEITDEWCLVKTKRGNVGWMICWGIDMPGQTAANSPQASPAEATSPQK